MGEHDKIEEGVWGMSDDIVARLLNTADDAEWDTSKVIRDYPAALREAAECIEALQVENLRRREAAQGVLWEVVAGTEWESIALSRLFDAVNNKGTT